MTSLLQMMGMPQVGAPNSLSSLFQNSMTGPYRPLQPVQQPMGLPMPAQQPQAPAQAQQRPQMNNPGWYQGNTSIRNFTPGIGAEDPMGLNRIQHQPGLKGQLMGYLGR